jgi:hypothetical protein
MPEQPKCESCKWWKVHNSGRDRGECRRMPPDPGPTEHGVSVLWRVWPETFDYDHCGEHTPQEPTHAND